MRSQNHCCRFRSFSLTGLPAGKICRISVSPLHELKRLHLTPDRARFTLIELLVSAACQIGVLPLYYLKKQSKKMPYNACGASASCTESALHICRRQMLHTAKPCFIRSTFTLIELLVVIAIIAILAAMLPRIGQGPGKRQKYHLYQQSETVGPCHQCLFQ